MAERKAAADARFAQLEIRRRIYTFREAAIGLPPEGGWGMRCGGC